MAQDSNQVAQRFNGRMTGRKRTSKALRASHERYGRFFGRSVEGAFRTNSDGRMIDWNESFARILGYASREEILARRACEFYTSPAPRQEFCARLKANGSVTNFEKCLQRRDGSALWVLDSVNLLNGENGTPGLIEDTVVDITERKRVEQELRDSEEKFRALFEGSRDAIGITTPTGKFLDANQAWLDLFGYTRQEMLELNVAEHYVHSLDRSKFRQELEQKGSLRDYEVKLGRKDGKALDCLITATVWRAANGEIIGYQSIIRDITDRKQAEKSLRELSGRLLHLQDEERRRLARELHDATAQSLVALAMNLALVKESAAELNANSHKILCESVGLAQQCSQEIRTLSYLLHPPLLEELGLASTLRWYADGFAKRSGIELTLELPRDLTRLSMEVETTLFRIVQESLTNIHRHSGSPTAKIRVVQDATHLTMEVADEGAGMAPAILERARGSAAALGVGIAGMGERARQLGGRLEIDSCRAGTTIRAILPLPRGEG